MEKAQMVALANRMALKKNSGFHGKTPTRGCLKPVFNKYDAMKGESSDQSSVQYGL